MLATAARLGTNPLLVTWLTAGVAAALLAAAFLRSDPTSPTVAAAHGHDDGQDLAEPPMPAARADDPIGATPQESVDPPIGDTRRERPPTEVVTSQAPVVAPKPIASPPIDPRDEVAARLAQRVLKFDQPTPATFETIRMQIEEITGVPIRYDEAAAAPRFRDAMVRLALADVALTVVLDEAAGQAGLEVSVEADGVTLAPAGSEVQARADVPRPVASP